MATTTSQERHNSNQTQNYTVEWPKLRRWAVVGVSPDKSKYGNKIYFDLLKAGYKVYAVNPNYDVVDQHKCYRSLTELCQVEKPDVVDLVIPPQATEGVIDECISLGIKRVWFQPGSEYPLSIQKAKAAGLQVVHDACIMIKKQTWKQDNAQPPPSANKDQRSLIILSELDCATAITMSEVIEIQAEAFKQLYLKKVDAPLRTNIMTEYGSTLFMPCYMKNLGAMGLKVVSIRPDNKKYNKPNIPASIFLLDHVTGVPLAYLDGTYLTSVRTAAASGVATRILSRHDVSKLGVFGSGPVAHQHVYAVLAVRPSITHVQIFNRTRSSAEALVYVLKADPSLSSVKITVGDTPEETVKDADIIVTATSATQPLFDGDLVKEGTHINCVGSFLPTMIEVDSKLIKKSLVVVDTKKTALEEAGELIHSLKQNIIGEEHILAELGEIVIGKQIIRKKNSDITLFKSCGLAVQDISVAYAIYKKAKALGLGTRASL